MAIDRSARTSLQPPAAESRASSRRVDSTSLSMSRSLLQRWSLFDAGSRRFLIPYFSLEKFQEESRCSASLSIRSTFIQHISCFLKILTVMASEQTTADASPPLAKRAKLADDDSAVSEIGGEGVSADASLSSSGACDSEAGASAAGKGRGKYQPQENPLKESDVGISEYINPHAKFHGILKERYPLVFECLTGTESWHSFSLAK